MKDNQRKWGVVMSEDTSGFLDREHGSGGNGAAVRPGRESGANARAPARLSPGAVEYGKWPLLDGFRAQRTASTLASERGVGDDAVKLLRKKIASTKSEEFKTGARAYLAKINRRRQR